MASTPYVVFSSNVATYNSPVSISPVSGLGSATASALRVVQSGAGQALDITNTGTSNAIRIRSGSDSAALLVDSSGRVGVGVSQPVGGAKLQVQGTTQVSDTLSIGSRISLSNANASASLGRLVTSAVGDTTASSDSALIGWLPFMNHLYDQAGSNVIGVPALASNISFNQSGRIGASVVAANPSAGVPNSIAVLPLNTPLQPTQAAGFTVAAWIKPYTTSTTVNRQFFFGSEGAFGAPTPTVSGSAIVSVGIEPTTNNLFAILQQSSGSFVTATSATAAANNTWTHVAAVFSGSTLTLYANGSALNNGNGPQSYTHSASAAATMANIILFTNYQTSTTGAFNGEVDDLRIYNRGLTAGEVSALAADTTPRLPAISTNSLSLNGGPLAFNATTTMDAVTTNASNLATTIQIAATDYQIRDLAGTIADPVAASQGTVSATRIGPFSATAPSEGSIYINNNNWAGTSASGASSNGSYLAASNAAAFGFNWWQSGGFTAEAFVNPDNSVIPSSQYIMGLMDPHSSTNYWSLYLSSGVLNFSYNNGSTVAVSGTTAVASNAWSHLAVSCDAGTPNNIRLFVNGNLDTTAAVSGTPVVSATASPLAIGQWNSSNAFSGYISNARITRGTALYTATFTPSTVPLASPATPSATPVLALRCAPFHRTPIQLVPSDGTVMAAKVGGQAATTSLVYPPRALNNYLTNIQNSTYGNGCYVVTASSEFSSNNQAWKVFDRTVSSWATSSSGTYSYAANGTYQGSSRTVDANGVSYLGEWVQLQMPSAIFLTSYSVTPRFDQSLKGPAQFSLLGSTDGMSWDIVSRQSGLVFNSTGYTFSTATTRAYNYFRFVIQRIYGAGTVIDFSEIYYYGRPATLNLSADGRFGIGVANPTLPLQVAGDACFSGNISANNLGMFRNRIINGDMRIAQRGSNVVITAGTNGNYPVDRFEVSYSITTGGLTLSQQTLTATDTPYQYGFRYAARTLVSTANSSFTYIVPRQRIEGFNIADFMWGTNFGSPITISFWFRTNMAANSVISLGLRNGSFNLAYMLPITVTTASAWQYVSAIIPAPSFVTTWSSDSNLGLEVIIGGYASGFLTATSGSWVSGNYIASSSSTNWYSTLNNYLDITGLQVEKGTLATPFEFRPYAVELQLCQRYYEYGPSAERWTFKSQTAGAISGKFVVQKRVPPTLSFGSVYVVRNDYTNALASGAWNSIGNITVGTSRITSSAFVADFTSAQGVFAAGVLDVFDSNNIAVWSANAEF